MKTYFPNLNTLRFIAASLVIVHHIELYKSIFNLENWWNIGFFQVIGKIGVVLFFVLSGFLITSLLLNEQKNHGFISIKKFYVRRILRIWPLYYLIVFLGFFVYPYINFFNIPDKNIFPEVLNNRIPNIFYYLTVFANLGWAIFKDVPYTSQTWSLATEEQFYIFWPFLIIFFRRRLLSIMVTVLISYWVVKILLGVLPKFTPDSYLRIIEILQRFWFVFNINCMAIGGIAGVLVFKDKPVVNKFIYNRYFFWLCVVLSSLFLICGCKFGFFHYEVYALLFAYIIINLSSNKNYEKLLENKVTNYLGSISYGMYMLHFPVLTISIKIGQYLKSPFVAVYVLTFGLTILLSYISYNYLEDYFLKLKSRFI